MKNTRTSDRNWGRASRGFSLVEMLVVIAVIGIISAIAVPSLGSISGRANKAKAQRNAQTLCSLYAGARSVGAEFSSSTKEGILDELIAGKEGPHLQGTMFKMSALSEDEKTAALEYCSFDADGDQMKYHEEGGTGSSGEGEGGDAAPASDRWDGWEMVSGPVPIYLAHSTIGPSVEVVGYTADGFAILKEWDYIVHEVGYLDPETGGFTDTPPRSSSLFSPFPELYAEVYRRERVREFDAEIH